MLAIFQLLMMLILLHFPPLLPHQYVYMDATLTTPCKDGGAGVSPCTVTITLDKDIPGPVYFYYTLDGFHQVWSLASCPASR
jgi:hypothetical protein